MSDDTTTQKIIKNKKPKWLVFIEQSLLLKLIANFIGAMIAILILSAIFPPETFGMDKELFVWIILGTTAGTIVHHVRQQQK